MLIPSILAYDRLEVAEEAAAERGLIVTRPRDDELQIDIDTPAQLEHFEKSWLILQREFGVFKLSKTVSSSGTGLHIRIRMPFTLGPMQRIAYQAALGSDPVRELLGLVRVFHGNTSPTLLFEKPDWVDPYKELEPYDPCKEDKEGPE